MAKLEIASGPRALPDRVCVYGVGGVGKSSLGKLAPKPVYIDADDGTGKLDVQRVEYATGLVVPPTLKDFYGTLDALQSEKHDRETVVVDTLDAIEGLVQAHVCAEQKMSPGEYVDYGRGTKYAIKEWRQIIAKLSELRSRRKMHVLLLAHYAVTPFKNPDGLDYDRYSLKLEKAPGKLIYDWCDTVAFARFEDLAATAPTADKRVRGVSTKRRYFATQHNAAWDAKARESIDDQIEWCSSKGEPNLNAWKQLNGEE